MTRKGIRREKNSLLKKVRREKTTNYQYSNVQNKNKFELTGNIETKAYACNKHQ